MYKRVIERISWLVHWVGLGQLYSKTTAWRPNLLTQYTRRRVCGVFYDTLCLEKDGEEKWGVGRYLNSIFDIKRIKFIYYNQKHTLAAWKLGRLTPSPFRAGGTTVASGWYLVWYAWSCPFPIGQFSYRSLNCSHAQDTDSPWQLPRVVL